MRTHNFAKNYATLPTLDSVFLHRETFWSGGVTNPLDVVEQMTYLVFILDLDATDNQRAKESAMLGLPHRSIFVNEVQVGE